MSNNLRSREFLKECMADALIRLMSEKDISKITVNEISLKAGVNRSTWFRNFSAKNDALTFKLVTLWYRWAEERGIAGCRRYTVDHAEDFFMFNYNNRELLSMLYSAGLQIVLYETFHQVMMPQYRQDSEDYYHGRFYSYGLFGMLEEWIKRNFKESPKEMTDMFFRMMHVEEIRRLNRLENEA